MTVMSHIYKGSGIIVMTFVGNPTLLSTIIYDNDVKVICPVIALSKKMNFKLDNFLKMNKKIFYSRKLHLSRWLFS